MSHDLAPRSTTDSGAAARFPHKTMVKELHTWTLGDLRERGEQFLFPGGDVPDLIPRRMWKLVEANPDH
ncbi:MAG: hypothetical protein PVH96_12845, partial [Gemmatimonadota bacterium]